jgi:arylsulfatase A
MTSRLPLPFGMPSQLSWLFLLLFSAVPSPAAGATHPNIIFILSDDLGYADIGPYGQKDIQTPALDKMAAEGMLFTDAYAGSPLCAPCRSTLFTGLHTGHTPIRHNPAAARGWNRTAQGDPPLPDDILTFAKVCKQRGYATACIGKYGLGAPGKAGSPDRLGFDYFYGYDSHVAAHDYYPTNLWRNNEKVALNGKTYSHDLFTKEAFEFVRAHRDHPFFLYLPYTIPHVKLDPPSIEPYADKPWPPSERAFAAMITRMDGDVGKLIGLLKSLDLDDQTVIMFAGDNGPCTAGGHKATTFHSTPFRSEKGHPYEGGIRVSFLARWPGHIPAGKKTAQPIAFWDVPPTWADLAGAPITASTDGISFLPTLLGRPQDQKKHDYLYWELAADKGFQEIRMGDWKADILHVSQPGAPKLELYNLKDDPAERNDVSSAHPDIVKRMEEIAKTAHTPNAMFPLTYEECQKAAPRGVLPKGKVANK